MIGYPYLRLGALKNLKLTGNLTLTDDQWAGLGAAAGRIVFDDQATDEISLMACRVGINTESPDARLEISEDAANAHLIISCYHNTEATTALITLRKADGTEAAPALVDDNAVLGTINFDAYDGSGWHTGAKIEARAMGDPSDGTDMPTEVTIWTCPNGSATLVQRMTITEAGRFGLGIAAPVTFFHSYLATGANLFRLETDDGSRAQIIALNDTGTAYFGVEGAPNTTFAGTAADSAHFGSTMAKPLHLGTNAIVRMTILSAGNVGIHTTNPQGTLSISNITEGGTAAINVQTAHETHTLAGAGTSDTTTISIPAGATLLGVSFCVNTAVSDDGGNDTWSAAFVTGSTATLGTAEAAAQNTKVNTMIVPEISTNVCQIQFTANGGSFDGGVIEIVAYYLDLRSLANV